MKTTGEVIKEFRKRNNLKLSDLAEMAGTAQSFITNVENNKRRMSEKIWNIIKEKLNKKDYLDVLIYEKYMSMPDFLREEINIEQEKENKKEIYQIPFFKDIKVSAGYGNYYFEDIENAEMIEVPQCLFKNSNIAVTVKGDSMEPELKNGDIIIVNCDIKEPDKKHYFVVEYKNDVFVKSLSINSLGIVAGLISQNRYYPPFIIEDIEDFKIIGRVESIYYRDYTKNI